MQFEKQEDAEKCLSLTEIIMDNQKLSVSQFIPRGNRSQP